MRAIVLALLVVMLWQSLRPSTIRGGVSIQARSLTDQNLAKWSMLSQPPTAIRVRLDSAPPPRERAWLAALIGAGSKLAWSGDLVPLMVGVRPVAAPTGGIRVQVAAPKGSSIALSDEVGAIDTVRSAATASAVSLGAVGERINARVGRVAAITTRRDSTAARRILVIGAGGWEAKFVSAALEENGWKVDAAIHVAPDADVRQGQIGPIDTARYSAVVALDRTAARYADRIAAFVRSGGGVVLSPDAVAPSSMASLRAGTAGRPLSPSTERRARDSQGLAAIALTPITSLRADAVRIDGRTGPVAIAARRIGAGRIVQQGYADSWQWRMSGGEDAVRAHRQWWTSLVSTVAYAPLIPRPITPATAGTPASEDDPAPLSALVASIGAPAQGQTTRSDLGHRDAFPWLFVLLSLALIGEVASRRMRGAS